MKVLKGLVIGILVASMVHIYMFGWSTWSDTIVLKWLQIRSEHFNETSLPIVEEPQRQIPEVTIHENDTQAEGISENLQYGEEEQIRGLYIGMQEQEVRELLGEPSRVDLSAYGYTWWIYNDDWTTYIQIGVKEGKVVTVYTNALQWGWGPFIPGTPKSEWQHEWDKQSTISFHYKLGYFTFDLTEADLQERPLMLDGDTAIQLYIDIHNENKISGLRLMDMETLLLHRPYALKYAGQLPEPPNITNQQWEEIERSSAKQIFDIVNVTRQWYQLKPFHWHEEVAEVAKGHSLDMKENEYFDHVSPVHGDLADRLQQAQVSYKSAGENIAWNYVDAADAHHGWLNSAGHRKNIIEPQFSHLGVGVIEKHYTQNFLLP